MPRKLDRLRKLSDEKNAFILERIDKLEKLVERAGSQLFEMILQDFIDKLEVDDGEIKNSDTNLQRISFIERAWTQYQQEQGARIITTFVRDLSEINVLGSNYYTELIPNQVASADVETIINKKLGIEWEGKTWTPKPKGYIDAVIKDRSIVTQVKRIAYNNVIAKTGPSQLRKEIQNYLVSTGKQPSEFKRFFDNFVFDTYSEVDRLNSSLHADRLGLQYFLFNGGLIRDSRQFCKDHHGKCYSTEEAEKWRDLIGKYKLVPGKRKAEIKVPIGPIVEDKETYEPVKDLGGIRCRHSADFVSDEIAESLRKGGK